MGNRIKKAVIPAAGLGTRFLPATKAQPKEMLPIVDKPTLQYIIEECVESGIEEIIIITGRNKKSIEDHFDKSVELELELARTGKDDLLTMVHNISNMAILGRYIITPEIFNILQNTKPGKGGEIQLTDALSILREKEGLYAYNFIGERYDIGDKLGFLQATVEYALRNPELKEGFLKFLLSINK